MNGGALDQNGVLRVDGMVYVSAVNPMHIDIGELYERGIRKLTILHRPIEVSELLVWQERRELTRN